MEEISKGLEEDASASISPFIEVGNSGLKRSGGNVHEEFIRELYGMRAIQVFREMSENDATVGAFLFAIDKLIRSVKWNVDNGEDGDEEIGKFIEECMEDMSHTWPDFISEVMTMLPYGWSYFELVYKKRSGEQEGGDSSKYNDGRIGWRKFASRSQDTMNRWIFDDNGGIIGMVQVSPPSYQARVIPMQKSLLFRTTTAKGNPQGRSVLRNAYRAWYFKKRIEEIEAIGVERDLAGLPIVYLDAETIKLAQAGDAAASAVVADYQQLVINIRRDAQEGVLLPSQFDRAGNRLISLELLSSGGARQFDTSGIIDRWNKAITMSVLADFILLGHEGVGSFALSSDKTDMFALALGAWLDSIEAVINTYAVTRLLKLNGMSTENAPRIVHGDIDEISMETITTTLTALAGIGMPVFPNVELQERIYERMGLPAPAEEVEGRELPVAPEETKPVEEEQKIKPPKSEGE